MDPAEHPSLRPAPCHRARVQPCPLGLWVPSWHPSHQGHEQAGVTHPIVIFIVQQQLQDLDL